MSKNETEVRRSKLSRAVSRCALLRDRSNYRAEPWRIVVSSFYWVLEAGCIACWTRVAHGSVFAATATVGWRIV